MLLPLFIRVQHVRLRFQPGILITHRKPILITDYNELDLGLDDFVTPG